MFLFNISVTNPATIIFPMNYFPIFLLIFKKNTLMIKIFTNLYDYLRCVVWFTTNVETLYCISDWSNCVLLCIWIFFWNFCLQIVEIIRKQMNSPPWKFCQKTLWSLIIFAEIFELHTIIIQWESNEVILNLESNTKLRKYIT